MKSILISILTIAFWTSISGQTCNILSDDYSNPSLWTKYSATGSNEIYISNGRLNYLKSIDGKDERVFRILPITFNNIDDWEIEMDFYPFSGGRNNYSGHEILALTAGSLNPLSSCPDPKDCSKNWMPQKQDGVIVMFGTNNPPATTNVNTFFSLHLKNGIQEIKSTNLSPIQIIYAKIGSIYHLRLVKCGNIIELHVSNQGVALGGSPISYQIPSNYLITGLNTIQHANSARGVNKRILSAFIDNLCVSSKVNNSPSISGINDVNSIYFSTKLYACEGYQCFSVFTKDVDKGQSLKLNLASALPSGAVFNQTTGSRPIGTICWDPGINNVGVYTFQLEVIDDYCIPKSQIYTYTIEVVPGYNLGGPISLCNNFPPLMLPDPGPGVWTINAQFGQTLNGNILDPSLYPPGSYTLTYCTPKPGYTSNCEGCWAVQLDILESPIIKFNLWEIFCEGEAPRQLTATPAGGTWSGGPYINSNGVFDPSLASVNNGTGNRVTYTVVLPNGCFDSKTIFIPVYTNGLGMSYDLGTHCVDEYLVLHDGGYRYELVEVIDLSTNSRPSNLPPLPLLLPGNTIHLSYLNNYINQAGNYMYYFKVWFKNSHGCEYYYEYMTKIVNCACSDTVAQNISISASQNPNFLNYNFSYTPSFNSIGNVVRYKWVITDAFNNIIKTLNYWDNTSGNSGASSFNYDFTAEYGTLFNCGYYEVFLQVVTQTGNGELSLCQTSINIPICDGEPNETDQAFERKTHLDNTFLTNIQFFPSPCNIQSYLNFELTEDKSMSIEIYNNLGRKLILIPATHYKSGLNEVNIECQDFEDGLYFLRISDGLHSKSIKFIAK